MKSRNHLALLGSLLFIVAAVVVRARPAAQQASAPNQSDDSAAFALGWRQNRDVQPRAQRVDGKDAQDPVGAGDEDDQTEESDDDALGIDPEDLPEQARKAIANLERAGIRVLLSRYRGEDELDDHEVASEGVSIAFETDDSGSEAEITPGALRKLICGLARVMRIDFTGRKVSAPQLDALRGAAATLRSLDLSVTGVTDNDLAKLTALTDLRSLALALDGRVTDAGAAHLAPLTSLVSLDLQGTQITDTGMASLHRMEKLEWLNLRRTRITGAGLKSLCAMKRLAGIDLRRTDVENIEGLRGLAALGTLQLESTPVTDTGLSSLATLTNLTLLNLSHDTQLTDAGLANLAGLTSMESLWLRDTQLTDAGMTYLCGMQKLENLRLDGTKIGDAGLKNIEQMRRLNFLTLDDTNVSDTGISTPTIL